MQRDLAHAIRISPRNAVATLVNVALLCLVSQNRTMAQSYTVTGTLPGAGARVTDFISTPDHFLLRVTGGRWPSEVGDTQGNQGAEQFGRITFGGPGQGGFWRGNASLGGFTQFHYDALVTSFGMEHLTPDIGPHYGDSLSVSGGHFYMGPFFWRPMEHGSDMDMFRATWAFTWEYPHEFVRDIQSYTWTLEAYHEVSAQAAAPEPGTLALAGFGLGIAGLLARRRRS